MSNANNLKRFDLWKPEFDLLATYNAEVERGLMHTDAWKIQMKSVQEDYYKTIENMKGKKWRYTK